MYALAVNGSPRKDGNTYNSLKEVLAPIAQAGWETEMVQAGGKEIRGCLAWLGGSVNAHIDAYPKP